MEKGFIEITNSRWWYEDKVGEVYRIHREIASYADEALAKPEKAFEVIDEEHGYCRVLARDCREWVRPVYEEELYATEPEGEVATAMIEYLEEARKEREARDDEMVHHPNHYTSGRFEAIEVIEDVTKGYEDGYVAYCVGNTQKYIKRAPFKHATPLEDLRKAAKYLEFAIKHLEGQE